MMRKLKIYISIFFLRLAGFFNRKAWNILNSNATFEERAFICYQELKHAGINIDVLTKSIEDSIASQAPQIPPMAN